MTVFHEKQKIVSVFCLAVNTYVIYWDGTTLRIAVSLFLLSHELGAHDVYLFSPIACEVL